MGRRTATTWVDALARLRPRDRAVAGPAPTRLVVDPARACAITGAKRAKKKCCRSKPKRCKNCPVVAMRLHKAGADELSGKAFQRALKIARIY